MIFSATDNNLMDSSAAAADSSKAAKKHRIGSADGGDGSSIEVAKRPRGRPPGSKNKPKPPVVITREPEASAALRPHILEIPSGHDLVDSIIRFSRRKNLGICVLAGNGAVMNMTLRQPPHPTAGTAGAARTLGFHGRFEILSLSATVMPPAVSGVFAPGAALTVAGPQGQVIGGTVVGPLVAAGTVTVVAATFDNPTFHRLPAVEDDVPALKSGSVSGGGDDSSGHRQGRHHQQQQQQEEDEEDAEEQQQQHYAHREYQHHHRHHAAGVADVSPCGMAIYSSHFPSEMVWPPTARPPHPPPF